MVCILWSQTGIDCGSIRSLLHCSDRSTDVDPFFFIFQIHSRGGSIKIKTQDVKTTRNPEKKKKKKRRRISLFFFFPTGHSQCGDLHAERNEMGVVWKSREHGICTLRDPIRDQGWFESFLLQCALSTRNTTIGQVTNIREWNRNRKKKRALPLPQRFSFLCATFFRR